MYIDDVKDQDFTICGVTAPIALWLSAGMEFVNHGETFTVRPKDSGWNNPVSDGNVMEWIFLSVVLILLVVLLIAEL